MVHLGLGEGLHVREVLTSFKKDVIRALTLFWFNQSNVCDRWANSVIKSQNIFSTLKELSVSDKRICLLQVLLEVSLIVIAISFCSIQDEIVQSIWKKCYVIYSYLWSIWATGREIWVVPALCRQVAPLSHPRDRDISSRRGHLCFIIFSSVLEDVSLERLKAGVNFGWNYEFRLFIIFSYRQTQSCPFRVSCQNLSWLNWPMPVSCIWNTEPLCLWVWQGTSGTKLSWLKFTQNVDTIVFIHCFLKKCTNILSNSTYSVCILSLSITAVSVASPTALSTI
jgi:hypothetical protein